MEKRHINVPIFIPHLGCPNACVFCDQRKISGKNSFVFASAKAELEAAFRTVDTENAEVEIAFFGGSFTGIDPQLMCDLLELAQSYVAAGKADGIRLSTRPDYINETVLDTLRQYAVKTIELGIQSVNDTVLSVCKRGHTFADTQKAVSLIRHFGFSFVGQMMVGLPASTLADELATAEFICTSGATGARIYPTVVFRHTELCSMAEAGTYVPLDTETAVERSAHVLADFLTHHVPVIRIGLHAGEELSDPASVYAGANHPALGEMVMSRVYLHKMRAILQKEGSRAGEMLTFSVAKGETSKAIGHRRENLEKLCQEFQIKSLKIVEKTEEILYNINLV